MRGDNKRKKKLRSAAILEQRAARMAALARSEPAAPTAEGTARAIKRRKKNRTQANAVVREVRVAEVGWGQHQSPSSTEVFLTSLTERGAAESVVQYVFLNLSANADGERRGPASPRPFRCCSPTRSSPRRSPSASPEKLSKIAHRRKTA